MRDGHEMTPYLQDRNITLRLLWERGQLTDAYGYLSKMHTNYLKVAKLLGECSIRIGLIGTGQAPNYRLVPLNKREITMHFSTAADAAEQREISFRLTVAADVIEQEKDALYVACLGRAYSGLSHRPLSTNFARNHDSWSHPIAYKDFVMLENHIRQKERLAKKAGLIGST